MRKIKYFLMEISFGNTKTERMEIFTMNSSAHGFDILEGYLLDDGAVELE